MGKLKREELLNQALLYEWYAGTGKLGFSRPLKSNGKNCFGDTNDSKSLDGQKEMSIKHNHELLKI